MIFNSIKQMPYPKTWQEAVQLLLFLGIPLIYCIKFVLTQVLNEPFSIWLLIVIAGVFSYKTLLTPPESRTKQDELVAIGCALLAAGCAIVPNSLGIQSLFTQSLAVFWILSAALAWFRGTALVFRMMVYWLVLILILPVWEPLRDSLTMLLRVMSAYSAAGILMLMGIADGVSGSQITVNGTEIAVTAACSGITLFESLVCIGWILVMVLYKKPLLRVIHFSLLFPIIILTNTIRLIALIGGMVAFGNFVITGAPHEYIGYVVVVLNIILFMGAEKLIRGAFNSESQDTPNENT